MLISVHLKLCFTRVLTSYTTRITNAKSCISSVILKARRVIVACSAGTKLVLENPRWRIFKVFAYLAAWNNQI